ncbi:MAG: flagellar protein FliS [Myxococcales bacterium]|nr:flagellar protein FliS [Myxococcales bacterium]
MLARAANTYRRVALESASPTRVLDELLGRLMLDIDQAEERIRCGDLAGKGRVLGHAMAVVDELALALNHEAAPDLCANLQRLYGFVRLRLGDANLRVDAEPLAAARNVLALLREAFLGAAPGQRP